MFTVVKSISISLTAIGGHDEYDVYNMYVTIVERVIGILPLAFHEAYQMLRELLEATYSFFFVI